MKLAKSHIIGQQVSERCCTAHLSDVVTVFYSILSSWQHSSLAIELKRNSGLVCRGLEVDRNDENLGRPASVNRSTVQIKQPTPAVGWYFPSKKKMFFKKNLIAKIGGKKIIFFFSLDLITHAQRDFIWDFSPIAHRLGLFRAHALFPQPPTVGALIPRCHRPVKIFFIEFFWRLARDKSSDSRRDQASFALLFNLYFL